MSGNDRFIMSLESFKDGGQEKAALTGSKQLAQTADLSVTITAQYGKINGETLRRDCSAPVIDPKVNWSTTRSDAFTPQV